MSARALDRANAPSRGGSTSHLSARPSASSMAGVMSNRLRATNSVAAKALPSSAAALFFSKFSRERATRASLPSMPSTSLAWVAIGRVKLPRPQNQSITRSCFCASSRRSARLTSTRLMWGLTWVKSVGLKGMRMPKSGSAYASSSGGTPSVPCGSSRWTVSGPLGCSHHCTPGWALAKLRRRPLSASVRGSRWRSTRAVTSSPQASSIWGQLSRPSMLAMRPRKGTSMALTWGGSTGHTDMSAT